MPLILLVDSSFLSLLNDAFENFNAFLTNIWLSLNLSKIVSNSFRWLSENHCPFTRSLNFDHWMELSISCSRLLGFMLYFGGTLSSLTSSLCIISTMNFSFPMTSAVILNSVISSCLMSALAILFTSFLIISWNWSTGSSNTMQMASQLDLSAFRDNRRSSEILQMLLWLWINRLPGNRSNDSGLQCLN